MSASKGKELPPVGSINELVQLFDREDLGDYLGHMPEAQFEIDLQRSTYLVAIDADLATKLMEFARVHETSTEELINLWLREKMEQVA